MSDFLIVGLGNPGEEYASTRHNFGFLVLEAFAKRHGSSFKRGWGLSGKVATVEVSEKKVHLLMPSTYMNLSGGAVRKSVEHFDIPLHQIVVVVDDVTLDFGTMRLQSKGGAKGHNGLKSIDAHLHTQEYPRLRMGIGGERLSEMTLEAYVLAPFLPKEQEHLPQLIEGALTVLECWLDQGVEPAAQLAGELTIK